jgi:hypothetical protein
LIRSPRHLATSEERPFAATLRKFGACSRFITCPPSAAGLRVSSGVHCTGVGQASSFATSVSGFCYLGLTISRQNETAGFRVEVGVDRMTMGI